MAKQVPLTITINGERSIIGTATYYEDTGIVHGYIERDTEVGLQAKGIFESNFEMTIGQQPITPDRFFSGLITTED